ncbi:hypothetical protein N7495_007542 [Penicillium taxi]|uniref:uncharacterized protein n=1 Tax=Penicillium taxi TaxID=168475 RepID=UPI002544F046|nr:uncharacterized protein N7495_007542 [Penicillium taxi]KAJ5887501.1 hypothetical protein N7495_007542 [Penicillium taxi]
MSSRSSVSSSALAGQRLSDDDASERWKSTKSSSLKNNHEYMSPAEDIDDNNDDDDDEDQSSETSSQDKSAIDDNESTLESRGLTSKSTHLSSRPSATEELSSSDEEDREMNDAADESTQASQSRDRISKSSRAPNDTLSNDDEDEEMSEATNESTRASQSRGMIGGSRTTVPSVPRRNKSPSGRSRLSIAQGEGPGELNYEHPSDMDVSPAEVFNPRASASKRSHLSAIQGEDTSEDESTHSNGSARTAATQISEARGSNSKRPRLSYSQPGESEHADSNDGDEDGESSDSSEAVENSARASRPRATVTEGVGPGGYKAGAIVRIKVTNFVTYTSAEFFPGPKLNMVIGPNGTGKSTLVCAICLGLGWGPKHLGRAKDLGEFVKHGCQEATIEIELAGQPKLPRNVVIRRNIKKDGNRSSFTVDNKPFAHAQVLKLAQGFAIQVDNLCQFLPQDKVAEFAGLTPIELLNSTQRAAAGEEMVNLHSQLMNLRSEQKKLQMDNTTDKETLKNLEDRQEMARPDVERMQQRVLIELKIELLELLRPFPVYKDWHRMNVILKERRDQTNAEWETLKKEIEPSVRAVGAKTKYVNQIKGFMQFQRKQVEELSKTAQTRDERINNLEASIKDLEDQIAAEKVRNKKDKTEELNINQNIVRLKRQRGEVVEFDPDYYNEQLREKTREKREVESQAAEIQSRRTPLNDKIQELERVKGQAQAELDNLNSKSGQQEAKLAALSRDSLKAYRWLLQNQDKFEKEVFGPVVVTCSVKDPKYSDAVENLLNRSDMTAFTTQSLNDFRTLQKALNVDMKLHDISIRTSTLTLNDRALQPPISTEQLQELGFDGWAHDLISGPEPVIAMLCSEKGASQTPVSSQDISDEAFDRLESGSVHGVNIWMAGRKLYQVTRRKEYGDKAKSTKVRDLRPAKSWTSKPVDASHKQQFLDTIRACEAEEADIKINLRAEVEAMTELRATRDRLDSEMEEIQEEKNEKQTAHTHARAIPEKIVQLEEKIKDIEARRQGVRDKVRGLRVQQDEIHIQKAEATIEYANAVRELQSAYEELVRVEVRHLEAQSDLSALVQKNHDNGVLLGQKVSAAEHALNEFQASVEKGRTVKREAKQAVQQAKARDGGPEVFETMGSEDYNVDMFNADLDSERARLELTHGGSASMIKEFETRDRQIQKLRDKLTGFESTLSNLQEGIDEVRAVWEPRLDALISKISDAFGDSFARIGCAGQVGLDKVESPPGPNGEPGGVEFDQWSILIHVKFRENENLSILDSHRQSGGERAVSTIFYLMALQSLSASPFRVVDEINQGMDPRNERMVHGRLVDIACASTEEEFDEDGNSIGGGGGGQYFLITPKLLNGLSYKKGMKVLCIFSGEHMPEDYRKLDFGKAVRTMHGIRRRSQGQVMRNVGVAA